MVWLAIYCYALPSLTQSEALVGLVSPIFITALLLLVSGIPILEKSADKKWGSDADYQAYKRRTSVLFLLPHRK
jgi:steroid 5-alpha reductase family enzyme